MKSGQGGKSNGKGRFHAPVNKAFRITSSYGTKDDHQAGLVEIAGEERD